MATRVLFQRRRLAVMAVTGLALTPATVMAEAPNDKRKPIYDDFETPSTNPAPPILPSLFPDDSSKTEEPEKPRGPTPTDRIAAEIGRARLQLYKYATKAEDAINNSMDQAFDMEQSFTKTITSLAPPRESNEKLMPGAIYVLVAAMAGSIITRNRNILLRASAPVVLGVVAANQLLPITSRNVSDLAWKYEQKFPALAESHKKAQERLSESLRFAKTHGEVGVRMVDEKVTEAREVVEGWVKQGK